MPPHDYVLCKLCTVIQLDNCNLHFFKLYCSMKLWHIYMCIGHNIKYTSYWDYGRKTYIPLPCSRCDQQQPLCHRAFFSQTALVPPSPDENAIVSGLLKYNTKEKNLHNLNPVRVKSSIRNYPFSFILCKWERILFSFSIFHILINSVFQL